MALNEDLLSMNVSHSIGLRRLENHTAEEVLKFYRGQRRALDARLKRLYPTSKYTKTKLTELRAVVNEQIRLINNRTLKMLTKELRAVGRYELQYQTQAYKQLIEKNLKTGLSTTVNITANITQPSSYLVNSAINNDAFQGQILNKWFSQFGITTQNNLNRALGISIFQGESLGEASRRIRRVTNLSTRHANTITRTAFRHTLNKAREEFAKENKLERKRYTAILDGRTTWICASLDGRTYDSKDRGAPDIPQHMGCRSDYVFYVDELEIATKRITIADNRSARAIDRDLRRLAKQNKTSLRAERKKWASKAVGSISGKSNFQTFFSRQKAGFQRAYLGDARYQLYKKGNLKLSNFVDSLTGERITLSRLRQTDARAFRLAGL